MAEVVALFRQRCLRRRGQLRFRNSAPERRKKKAKGFDVSAALELNLDRCPTKESLQQLLRMWSDAAQREGLATREPSYAQALRRAADIMARAANVDDAIAALQ